MLLTKSSIESIVKPKKTKGEVDGNNVVGNSMVGSGEATN